MVVAADLPKVARQQLLGVPSERLVMPERFLPDQNYLEHHRRRFHAQARAVT